MGATIWIIVIASGYLSGSIPFGKIVGRTRGIDIQKRGSGNIGFANVRRVLGWRAGLLTLVGDILKGYIPSALTLAVTDSEVHAFICGLAAIAGHLFPVWLKFKGGKGIATGLGLVIALSPLAALIGSLVYVLSAWLLHKSSTASMIGVFSVVATAAYLDPRTIWQYFILLVIALWTLRHNLRGNLHNYDT